MNPLKTIVALFNVTRPHNCVIASVSVLVGFVIAGGEPDHAILRVMAVTFLAAGGGYVINDIYDVETDRVVKPWRPLPRGLSKGVALAAAVTMWALGLVIAWVTSRPVAIFYTVWLLLLLAYSVWLKRAGFVGHALIAVVGGSGLLLGALLGGNVMVGYFPFAIGSLFHFSREVIKGLADYEGDSHMGIETVAVRVGLNRARSIALICLGMAIIVSLVPAALGIFGPWYMLVVGIGVYPLIVIAVVVLRKARTSREMIRSAARAAMLLKVAMPIGLLAFVAGG